MKYYKVQRPFGIVKITCTSKPKLIILTKKCHIGIQGNFHS